jgi:hypothetical protein
VPLVSTEFYLLDFGSEFQDYEICREGLGFGEAAVTYLLTVTVCETTVLIVAV